MIIDHIDKWNFYFNNPLFEEIFAHLSRITAKTPDGVIRNHEDYYFNVMSYETLAHPQVIESHQKEVDIQILLEGREVIKLYDRTQVQTTKPYEADTDCEFYKESGLPHTQLLLKPGIMGVFFPQDIHCAKNRITQDSEILKKVVIKVKKEFF